MQGGPTGEKWDGSGMSLWRVVYAIVIATKHLYFVSRIVRGTNNLGVESDCDWAVPVKSW